MQQKTIAITYVILRRAKMGNFGGGHSIKGNILAPKQFYGMTLNTNGSPFKGKACSHTALVLLDTDYKQQVMEHFEENTSDYMRSILHLLPSDTTTGDDAQLFMSAFETVRNAVDSLLANKVEDISNGALYFGYIGDLFNSKYHQPGRLATYVGGLGPYETLDELLADRNIQSFSYRLDLYNNRGVDAIVFYK
jgi:hypothetical protein